MKELPSDSSTLPPMPIHMDALCDRFEEAWKKALAGEPRPRLEDFLAGIAEPELQTLLIELLGLEIGYRRQLGETPVVAEYQTRCPGLPPERLAQELTLREREQASVVSEVLDTVNGTKEMDLSRLAPDQTAAFGTGVPGYEILGELGRGGMGVVYKARHLKLNRIVALKMILSGSHAGTAERSRFQTEAEAIARLQHPNIVQVYEVGEHEGKSFFSLEFCGGGSLARKLNGTPLPAREAAALVETLARAMQAAHDQHIIHRDLKPANILLAASESGVPKITDFGLAKKLDEAGQTHSGAILGTPSYMAPEQASGKGREIGPLADVYALGAILYECLTGRPPFKAATALDTIVQVTNDEPAPPSQLQTRTPRDLETICLKCLRKDPAARYPTAQALAEDLARFRAGEPVLARPVGQLERGWRLCRRNPMVAGLTAATALLLMLLATGSTIAAFVLGDALADSEEQRGKAEQAEKAVAKERDDAQKAEHREQHAKQDALNKLAQAYLEQARAKTLSGRMGQRFESLDLIKKAMALTGPTLELRNAALACLVLPDARVVPGQELPPNEYRFTIAPDFKHYARWNDHTLQVLQVSDNLVVAQMPCPGICNEYDGNFSPNSQLFGMWYSNGQFRVWRLGGGAPKLALEGEGKGLAFSADSRQVAVSGSTNICRILEIADKREVQKIAVEENMRVAFHPQLPRLAVVGPSQTRIIDVDTGRVVAQWPTPGSGGWKDVVWHPEGRLLAICRNNYSIHVCDPDTGLEVVPPMVGDRTSGIQLCFNHSGNVLASTSWHGTLRLWDPWTGRQLFNAPVGPNANFRFSNDDRLLAWGFENGRRGQLVEMAFGRELRVLQRPVRADTAMYENHARLSGNGQVLAVGTETGVALLELRTGRELTHQQLDHARPIFFDSTDALWLNRRKGGVQRWPLRVAPEQSVEYGPPQQVTTSRTGDIVGFSEDGQVLAIPLFNQSAMVLHRGQNPFTVRLGGHRDCRFCAVSPDGRWATAGDHGEGKIAVYDARTGKEVKLLNSSGGESGFSPDGRWLAVLGNDLRLWEVDTWKQGALLEGTRFAFAPDSRTIAVETGYGAIRVLRVPTGKELYRLEVPEQTRLHPQCFTADGAQLIARGQQTGFLYVWDLRTLRQQLRELNLDWDEPTYPPAPPKHPPLTAKLHLRPDTLRISHPESLALSLTDVLRTGADRSQQANHTGSYRLYQGCLMALRPYLAEPLQQKVKEALEQAAKQPSAIEQASTLHKMVDNVQEAFRPKEPPQPAESPSPKALNRSLQDVVAVGAKLFDQGNARGCYHLYQGALLALRPLLLPHPQLLQEVDASLKSAEELVAARDQAWALRRSVDRVREAVPPLVLLKGSLTAEDPVDAFPSTRNSFHKVHVVPLKAGTSYWIDLEGTFDTLLRVEDAAKQTLLINDDVTPPKILHSRLIFSPAKSDDYRLVVTSFRPKDIGSYTLSIREAVKASETTVIKGELGKMNPVPQGGKFVKSHRISLLGGSPYTLDLKSLDFDTTLTLLDATGKGWPTKAAGNPRASRLDFTPAADGACTLVVSSIQAGQTGAYTLTIQRYEEAKKSKQP